MDDEEETYRLWKIRKTIMQVGNGDSDEFVFFCHRQVDFWS